ncbi:MAG: CheR family methyltransferase [Bacteroidota bacterium]
MKEENTIIPLPDQYLHRLNQYLNKNLGLNFPKERWRDLSEKFHLASIKFGFTDEKACVEWLEENPATNKTAETLAAFLTIGETYFYRDKNMFANLEKHVLPDLIRKRSLEGKYLRIWIAGCSTGEEAYSVAAMLNGLIHDINDWDVSILATDINEASLSKAREGIYKKWSLRGTPDWFISNYLVPTGDGRYRVRNRVRKMLVFRYHNLAEDPYPSMVSGITALDLVFCRNVLMYFHPDTIAKVVNAFYRSLVKGGWLIVSGSEGPFISRTEFSMVSLPGTIIYRKGPASVIRKPLPEAPGKKFLPPAIHKTVQIPVPLKPATKYKSVPVSEEKKQTDSDMVKAEKLYMEGYYNEASLMLLQLVSADQSHGEALELLARVLANQGAFSEARSWCEKLLRSDSSNHSAHFLHSLILREQGEVDESIRSLQRTIYLKPDFVMAHYCLGKLAHKKGNNRMAERYLGNVQTMLQQVNGDELLPQSDGITAGRLLEILRSFIAGLPKVS